MPVGLGDNLTRAQLADLVRFLSELGKSPAYSVDRERVVRRWQMAVSSPGAEVVLGPKELAGLTSSNSIHWVPCYSRVSGVLTARDVASLPPDKQAAATYALRFELDVTTPGKVALKMPSEMISQLWVDEQQQKPAGIVELDLTAGSHTVTLLLHTWTEPLRIELLDVPGSKAQTQLVGGK